MNPPLAVHPDPRAADDPDADATLVPLGDPPDPDTLRATSLRVIESLRPGVQADGGDLQLVEIIGDKVYVRLSGACTTCSLAGQTLGGVRRHLVRALGWPVRVVPAVSSQGNAGPPQVSLTPSGGGLGAARP